MSVPKGWSWKEWYAVPENRERHLARQRATNERAKKSIFDFYGNKCANGCNCDPRVLQVDHVNGKGHEERRTKGHGWHALWKRIQEHPENYQLLCANCNWLKRYTHNEHNARREEVFV